MQSFAEYVYKILDKKLGIRVSRGSNSIPLGVEKEAWGIISEFNDRTMASPLQKYLMWQATNYIIENEIEGAIIEFGVWRGGMPLIAAKTLQEKNAIRDLYLFDTFDGMTQPSEFDLEIKTGKLAAKKLSAEPKFQKNKKNYNTWCTADIEDVVNGFEQINYDKKYLHLVKGDVLDTVPFNLPEVISICRIDVDWYAPTKHLLMNCYGRIAKNGLLIIDDYDHWGGARLAVKEFFDEIGEKPLLLRPDSGRILIKV